MNQPRPSPHSAPAPAQAPKVNKLLFCWLALLAGLVGGHWLYAGQRRFVWYLLVFPLAPFLSWADCMRFGLMPDEQFNQRFNPTYPADTPQTNGLVVTAVALSLGAFVTALMSTLAMLFQLMFAGAVA